jgi:hypothetical protein
MPAALLRLVCDIGERAMDASAAMLGSVGIDHRAEERMREADATTYKLEDARVGRRRDRALPVLDCRGHDRAPRLPERCNDEQRRARLARKRGQPIPDELTQRLGNRQDFITFGGFGGGPRKFEREERVSAGRVVDPKQLGSAERHRKLRANDSPDRAERECPNGET